MKELLNADITEYSTFKLQAKAKRLVVLESIEDIETFFTNDPSGISGEYYLIGIGSNTFLSENIDCLIKLDLKGIEWGEKLITIYACEDWNELVLESVEKEYVGIEPLAAIPGTVGAAPVQNIGAYGREFSDVCHSVLAFDREEKRFKTFLKDECEFGYRSSIFKKNKNRFIIASVIIELERDKEVPIPAYPGVKEAIEAIMLERSEKNVTPRVIYDAITRIRWSKLPKPMDVPNVGSCFENPVIQKTQAEELKKIHSDMPVYPVKNDGGLMKVSAGWLIDACGLKDTCVGGICIYEKHALVLVNKEGKGTMEDCRVLVDIIQKKVREKFGIQLVLEPNVVV